MAPTKGRLDASNYDTDKAAHTHHLRNYEEYFRPPLDRDVRPPELGVLKGGSLLLWRDYFERGVIAGLDLNPASASGTSSRTASSRAASTSSRTGARATGTSGPTACTAARPSRFREVKLSTSHLIVVKA
jgi:hypothetical protein